MKNFETGTEAKLTIMLRGSSTLENIQMVRPEVISTLLLVNAEEAYVKAKKLLNSLVW